MGFKGASPFNLPWISDEEEKGRSLVGETYVEVKLKANGKEAIKKLLVDTGSTFSWIRTETLQKLEVKPTDKVRAETVEGRRVVREISFVEVECLGRRAPTLVVFARGRDSEVLGLHALEGLMLEVDPVRGEVRKVKAIKAF